MFTMDVPYVPAQDTPIVLAQAATPGATLQPDYLLNTCQESASASYTNPRSAMHAVDPAFMLKNYLEWNDKTRTQKVDLAAIKTTLLESTTHGNITEEIDNLGLISYRYDPIPNYVGNDKAVFTAEFEGKVYKIVINLVVSLQVNENPLTSAQQPVCPQPQLIKINGKPVSGSSGFDFGSSYSSTTIGTIGDRPRFPKSMGLDWYFKT